MAIIADQPAHESEKQLAERRVDIKEVRLLEVVRGELDKMDVSRAANGERGKDRRRRTLPKWTSSKTTSFGWLIPQNRVTKAKAVMTAKTTL
jgi:hypothetical protein